MFRSLLAGREGFEPTTRGFGIRCSTVGATGLHDCYLLALGMNCVLTAEPTVFLKLNLVWRFLLVLLRHVVLALAFLAIEAKSNAHLLPTF